MDTDPRLEEIRAREQAATKGPWAWCGNTEARWLALETSDRMLKVMDFARYGMNGAQPLFAVNGVMEKASTLVEYEVHRQAWVEKWRPPYRHDIDGIKAPDAQFIAHARADVTWLVAELTEARTKLEIAERRNEELAERLAKYEGHEPTVDEELAYLNRCLNAVQDVCDKAESNATRWEQPLPVPEWVTVVRAAATGSVTEEEPAGVPW